MQVSAKVDDERLEIKPLRENAVVVIGKSVSHIFVFLSPTKFIIIIIVFVIHLNLKKNIGATGGTGQWVVSDLLSKGFGVRAFVRNLKKAEDLFGWDGSNLDVFEGDVKNYESLEEACKGAIAVIYCAGSREILGGNSFLQVDGIGVENAVKAAEASGGKGRGKCGKTTLRCCWMHVSDWHVMR